MKIRTGGILAAFSTGVGEAGVLAGLAGVGADALGFGEARGATAILNGVINKYGAGVATYFLGQAGRVGAVPAGESLISGKELWHSLVPGLTLFEAIKDVRKSCR